MFVQVILGVAYQRSSGIDPGQLHVLYGFAGLFAVALLYGYRAQIEDRKYMLYGCGGLFLMGLGIRALFLHA